MTYSCPVCSTRQECPMCGALLGDHDLDQHAQWNATRTSNPTRAVVTSPQNGSWQEEISRLLRVNERQRVELQDALDREEQWRRAVQDNNEGVSR